MRLWILLMTTGLLLTAAEKVFIDTDCAEFGDDGAALIIAARAPGQVQLLGVSAVSGNVWAGEAAAFARRILSTGGIHSVAVTPGAALPLVRNEAMVRDAHRRWGGNGYHGAFDRKPAAGEQSVAGIQALVRAIETHAGEVTILALGPMTNLAIALRLRPDLESRIRRLVFMGGNVHVPGNTTHAAEFNIWFDPEAASVVFRSAIREKVMFPLDITNRAPLTRALFDRVVAVPTPVTALYREDLGERYPGFLRDPAASGYLWDELAAAWLVDASFVTAEETRHLDVQTVYGERYGAVIPLDRRLAPGATPIRVMLDLDLGRLTALYLEKLTAR